MSEVQENTQERVEERDRSKPILKISTVSELGDQMPFGLYAGDGVPPARALDCRDWTLVEEKVLGHRRDEDKDRNMGKYISIVLASMLTRLGGNDWSGKMPKEAADTANREVVLSQMFMGDVWFTYIWLRIQAMGEELEVQLDCPHPGCNGQDAFPWVGKLTTLEVKYPEKLEDALYDYTLRKGIKIHGTDVKTLTLGPPRWSTVEAQGDPTAGAMKGEIIACAVHGSPEMEHPFPVTEADLIGLGKYDIEKLVALVNKHTYGPDMSIEAKCPRGHKLFTSIDWRFDQFFGISSR